MRDVVGDLRFALRLLLEKPGFSAAVVLSLALAIGANAAIFSLVNAVTLGTLPVRDPDRVVALFTLDEKNPGHLPVSELNFRDIEEQAGDVLDTAAYTFAPADIGETGGDPLPGLMVTSRYFDVLGVEPVLGRTFEHDDDELGAHPEVVLSHALWQERFGGDPGVVGTRLVINEHPMTVVGVAPEGFHGTTLARAALFVPFSSHRELMPAAEFFGQRRFLAFFPLGRLRDGASLEQANAELARIGEHLADAYPVDNGGRTFRAVPVAHAVLGPDQRGIVIAVSALMMTIVGFVLLIACANAANLMLARATARRAEIAVRRVLGASPGRIVRQVIVEGLVLAAAAGILGVLLAHPAADFLWSLRPGQFQFGGLEPEIDGTVLGFTFAITAVAGVVFAAAPALRAARVDLVTPLKEETTPTAAAGSRFGLRSVLVVLQVALSMVALVGAGLFARSMANARAVDPGFETDGMLLVDVDLTRTGTDPEVRKARRDEVLAAVRALPEIDAASSTTFVPLSGNLFQRTVYIDGRHAGPEDGTLFNVVQVGAGFFDVMGQPILEGRGVGEPDDLSRPRVAVVNDAFARRFWPDGGALGRRIRFMGYDDPIEIVGIASTAKHGALTEDPTPVVYVPLDQWPAPGMTLLLRSPDPQAAAPAAERAIAALGETIRAGQPRSLEDQLEGALFGPRTGALLLGTLGLLGLLLATVGLYGLMVYTVRQRTREIGIRMALGARPRDVVRFVLLQATALVVLGIGIGVAGGLVLQNALADLLFEVPPADPIAFGGATLVLAAIALIAGWLPARQATRISPTTAMHHD